VSSAVFIGEFRMLLFIVLIKCARYLVVAYWVPNMSRILCEEVRILLKKV